MLSFLAMLPLRRLSVLEEKLTLSPPDWESLPERVATLNLAPLRELDKETSLPSMPVIAITASDTFFSPKRASFAYRLLRPTPGLQTLCQSLPAVLIGLIPNILRKLYWNN
jgi:hypothetical protein